MTKNIKEIWNTSNSTKKRQLNLTQNCWWHLHMMITAVKKVDREIEEAQFKFIASVNRQL